MVKRAIVLARIEIFGLGLLSLVGCGADGAGGTFDGPPPPLCTIDLMCPGRIPDEPKIDCAMRVVDGFGAPVYEGFAGVEVRGRSSQSFPKRSYGIELRDADGDEADTDLLGMGVESDYILDGCWADRSFMRNALAYDLYAALSPQNYAAEGRFCEMTLDGEPAGIYRLAERVKRAPSRIDLPDDDGTGSTFVIKQDDGGQVRWDVGEQSQWRLIYPKDDKATAQQLEGIQGFLDDLDQAMRQARRNGDDDAVFDWLALDPVVDFVILEELAKNVDAYNLSLHLFRNAAGLAQPVPWDFDLSMGQPQVPGTEQDSPEGWTRHGWLSIEGIAASPRFRARLAERYRALRTGPLSEEAVEARIDRMQDTLTPEAIERNFERWPLDQVRFNGIVGPYELYRVDSYGDEVMKVREFLRARLAWLDAHIDEFPN